MSERLPRCPRCEQPMRWVRSLPAFAGHPELQSFECRGCREALTISTDREAFPKTVDFGRQFNAVLDWGGFRVQELPDPLQSVVDMPAVGRNYDVYFNRLKVGSLKLRAQSPVLRDELSGISFWLELLHPLLFEYGQLRSFLVLLGRVASDHTDEDFERREIDADRAMTRALWDAMRGRDDITLEFVTSGPAIGILKPREA